jgi:DNA topoisomerase-1
VGNEKNEDEADTVGCCSLKVQNVSFEEGNKITLDFLGKDSMRYLNTVEVTPIVYKNLKKFH